MAKSFTGRSGRSKSSTFTKQSQYPLEWPIGFPTTKYKTNSQFRTTLYQALQNVNKSLSSFARDSGKRVTEITVTSNYSEENTRPKNAGVSLWFMWDGEQTCIPIDRYKRVEDNLQAVYHCLEAERTKLRHGGINMVKATFLGLKALPSPDNYTWRDVLNYQGDDITECKSAYKKAAQLAHPDKPDGSDDKFNAVNNAWLEAQKELKPL